jgi:hypothetical protein
MGAAVFDGRVVEDHNGSLLPRVEIRITRSGVEAIVAELETDSQGRFQTPDLPDAPYSIWFSKPNFSAVEANTEPRAGMQIRMIHFGAISGHVYFADGGSPGVLWRDSVIALTAGGARAGIFDHNARAGEYRIYGLMYRIAVVRLLARNGGVPQGGILYQPDDFHPREFVVLGGEDYTNAGIHLLASAVYSVSARWRSALCSQHKSRLCRWAFLRSISVWEGTRRRPFRYHFDTEPASMPL